MVRALAILLFALAATPAAAQTGTVTVFAAASLGDAMQEIGTQYEAATHVHVRLSFAGSMTLAKQIESSTGVDIFVSADEQSMDYLQMRNLIVPGSRANLVGNTLVLIAPAASKTALAIAPGMKLVDALNGGRLALADPDSVPAGRYGRAALTALGVWDGVKNRLAPGEDVRATLALVARGEAPLGIVYGTDAAAERRVRVAGTFPADSHPPIVYPAALTKDAKPAAARFLAYLKGPEARAVFGRRGFAVLAGTH